MARGRLEPPDLDDRTWKDLVDQAKGLITQYTGGQWTDTGEADLGITLVELFAWLVESMTYRLNRVPERNYITFLNLIGITRDPGVPATTALVFTPPPLANAVVTVPARTQVATAPTEARPAVVFETDQSADVVPTSLVEAHLATLGAAPLTTTDVTSEVIGPGLGGHRLEVPAGGLGLFLGLDRPLTPAIVGQVTLSVTVAEVQGAAASATPFNVTWEYQHGLPDVFSKLTVISDETGGLLRSGRVTFTTPADWVDAARWQWTGLTAAQADPTGKGNNITRSWLRLRLNHTAPVPAGVLPPRVELSSVLLNAAPATNALTTTEPERFTSDGTPFQRFELKFRPLFRRPATRKPYDHLEVNVQNTDGTSDRWSVVEEFPASSPQPGSKESQVVRLDPVTGTLEFGDGIRGQIPPQGTVVTVSSYRYVAGGADGNVATGLLTIPVKGTLPGGLTAKNPGPAQGGGDEESVEQAMRRGPEALRNRSRAVTVEDFEFLTREASTRVRKVRCLGPAADVAPMFGGLDRSPGRVNVIIVPDDPDVARPRPSADLIREVQAYLDDLRVVTTSVKVDGPKYLPVKVTMEVSLFPTTNQVDRSADFAAVLKGRLDKEIRAYLHPLTGGKGDGWEVGQPVFVSGLVNQLQPIIGADGFISRISLPKSADLKPDYVPAVRPDVKVLGRFAVREQEGAPLHDVPVVAVSMADYELVCSDDSHDTTPIQL